MKRLPTPSARIRALHLLALSAFAVAAPMLDRLGRSPEYFVVRGYHAADVVLYALGLFLLVPAVLFVVELLAGLVHRRLLAVVHTSFVFVLAFVVVARTLYARHPSSLAVVGSAVLAVACAAAYRFWQPARSFLTVLALAPLLLIAVFLFRADLGSLTTERPVDAPSKSVRAETPVVLVIFDELALSSLLTQDGGLDAIRYPNFARLARTSTWYRNATTVHDVTDQAVPAILTGRITRSGELPIVADHPSNLFTLLGGSYRVNAVQAETRLCPADICADTSPALGARLRNVLSDVGTSSLLRKPLWVGDWKTPTAEVAAFLQRLGAGHGPRLDVMHVLLPHVPYRYLPSGRAYSDAYALPGYQASFRWSNDSWFVGHNYRRYLLQLAYTDEVLGKVIRRLRSLGVWDRAQVIVTADHGVSFRPGGHRRYVDASNIGDIAPIPLFVKFPGQREGRVDHLEARSVDILPTVADVLGIDVPWRMDGQSLRAPSRRPPARAVVRSLTGHVVEASWRVVTSGESRTVRWKTRLFGTGADSVFAEGPDRQLLGEQVAALPNWEADSIRAVVRQPSSLEFDPRSGSAPARVGGTLTGVRPGDRLKLAIAVNGRVVAVTRAHTVRGKTTFSTFVPDTGFRPGANAIAVLALRKDGALARIGAQGTSGRQSAAGS